MASFPLVQIRQQRAMYQLGHRFNDFARRYGCPPREIPTRVGVSGYNELTEYIYTEMLPLAASALEPGKTLSDWEIIDLYLDLERVLFRDRKK